MNDDPIWAKLGAGLRRPQAMFHPAASPFAPTPTVGPEPRMPGLMQPAADADLKGFPVGMPQSDPMAVPHTHMGHGGFEGPSSDMSGLNRGGITTTTRTPAELDHDAIVHAGLSGPGSHGAGQPAPPPETPPMPPPMHVGRQTSAPFAPASAGPPSDFDARGFFDQAGRFGQ